MGSGDHVRATVSDAVAQELDTVAQIFTSARYIISTISGYLRAWKPMFGFQFGVELRYDTSRCCLFEVKKTGCSGDQVVAVDSMGKTRRVRV